MATSNTKQRTLSYLKRSDVLKYFDSMIYGDGIEKGKPNPDIFYMAAKSLDLLPQNCMVLEDSENGLKAALAAGCHTVFVRDVCPVADKTLNRVLKTCDDLDEVLAYMKSFEK